MITAGIITMGYKDIIVLTLILTLIVGTPYVIAKHYFDKDYIVKQEGTYYGNMKLQNPDVWIDYYEFDGNDRRLYHVDSKRDFQKNEYVKIFFYYKTQPDYIDHITHSGSFENRYYYDQWEWKDNCNNIKNELNCSGGWVILNIYGIEKGLGSSTFPIGINGSTWSNDSVYITLEENVHFNLSNGTFSLIDPRYQYNNISILTTILFNDTAWFEDETLIYQIEYDNFTTMIFFVIFLVCAGLFMLKLFVASGSLLALAGFTLLFNSFNPIISFVIITGGVIIIFIGK